MGAPARGTRLGCDGNHRPDPRSGIAGRTSLLRDGDGGGDLVHDDGSRIRSLVADVATVRGSLHCGGARSLLSLAMGDLHAGRAISRSAFALDVARPSPR